jgi:hypothetical protein
MLNQLLRSFVRAYGRGAGYQAVRATGWLIWPLLLAVVGFIILVQIGVVPVETLPFDLDWRTWKSMLLNHSYYMNTLL